MTLPLFRRPPGADERQLSLLGWFLQEVREVYGLPTGDADTDALFSSIREDERSHARSISALTVPPGANRRHSTRFGKGGK